MLEVQDVTKRYGGHTAVNHVSFTVKPGEVLGYLGPNGSGKSTTVKMITGLMPPTLGRIMFEGSDIADDLSPTKRRSATCPRKRTCTYLTGPEYWWLTGHTAGIDEGPLEDKINRFLKIFGLDADSHAPLSAFSKGMRQKILPPRRCSSEGRRARRTSLGSRRVDRRRAAYRRRIARKEWADHLTARTNSRRSNASARVIILSQGKVVADDSASRLRELTKEASLEGVFSQLAVKADLGLVAASVIDAMTASDRPAR
jgi:ABC-2 type transport system ATP-binding protein